MGRGFLIILVISLTAALVWGSAVALAQGQSEPEKHVLRIGWLGDVDSLNPFVAVNSESYEIFRLMYSLLTGWGQDLEPVPDLAERWESSPDNLTWTFHLVQDARWTDGQPVTSADVKFTFRYVIDNKMDMFLNYVKYIEDIETPDPYTVILHLEKPVAFMPQIYVWILPEHIWKNIPPDKAGGDFANDGPVGCGPFRLVEFKKGESIRFQANKDYFAGAPCHRRSYIRPSRQRNHAGGCPADGGNRYRRPGSGGTVPHLAGPKRYRRPEIGG